MSEIKFDKNAWRRLVNLAKPFFFSNIKWWARGLLLLLALFSISNSLMNVLMSYANRDLMTALSLKEKSAFIQNLYLYLGVFICTLPFVVFYRYTEERLGLLWRRWLSHRILERYFSNRAYYKIGSYEGIDNPDQRIEEDIRSFTVTSLSLLLIVFNSLITIIAFLGILWSISIYLIIAVIVYAMFGTVTTYLLGRPLIGLNFQQLKREADYRYKLVNIRDNAESIAFYRDEGKEFTRVRQRLKNSLGNLLNIIKWNRNLNFFTTSYNFMIGIIPIVIVSPLYLSGEIEFGVVTQAAGAFVQVVNGLSVIVLNFGSLSALTAVVTRLGTFSEALEDANRPDSSRSGNITIIEAPQVAFKNVTIRTPRQNQDIIKDLTLTLDNQSLFIQGPSGTGKSSILRILAGVWSSGSGTIIRPPLRDTMFLPQRPYMILGTFRSQLLYGHHDHGIDDDRIYEVVEQVGLTDTLRRIGGLASSLDWQNFLSNGEQQRVAFGRLLLARRSFAFLDEATTAIDEKTEARLYTELATFTKVIVSIGYRASLKQRHTHTLELTEDGSWTFTENLQ